tara:strand:+ start:222 stop:1370 length:1149 start_codon:yes stop_codon:yes gene_type:complete
MGLSVFQSLAIAGGKAAETISRVEKDQKAAVLTALSKSIDDAKVPAGAYRQKHMLIKSKAKSDLNEVINTYFTDSGLTEVQKAVAGSALLKKHSYKIENINKSYESNLTTDKALGNSASKAYSKNSYLSSQFAEGALKGIKGQSLDKITSLLSQNIAGPAPLTTEAFGVSADAYKSSSIFTNPINPKEMALKAAEAFGLPKRVDGEIENVALMPSYDSFNVASNVQKYNMNEAQMTKWKDDALADGITSMADWQKLHKVAVTDVTRASKLDVELIEGIGGNLTFKFKGGADQDKLKRIAERHILRNFVVGAAGSDRLTDKNFLAYVQNVGSSVKGLSYPLKSADLIPGMTYKRTNGSRVIFTGIKNKDGTFYNIDLISATPQ